MTNMFSWFRRVGRSVRVCLASLALLVLWSVPQLAFEFVRPEVGAPLLLTLGALFAWRYWIRPGRFRRRRGRADVRLRRLPRQVMPWIVIGILLTSVADYAFYLLNLRFLPVPAEDPFRELYAIAEQPLGWLVVLVLAVLLAPLIEETVFRGWIQRPLERQWGAVPAVVTTAILFALVHGIVELLPYYFVTGLVLGTAAVITRSLWAPVFLHLTYNLQAVGLTLLGTGTYESELELVKSPSVVALAALVLVPTVIALVRTGRHIRVLTRPARPTLVGVVPEAAAVLEVSTTV
jgi:membrane protease YdiL (CAAX protease family)